MDSFLENGTKAAVGFFRIFDVAFFVPGSLAVGSVAWWWPGFPQLVPAVTKGGDYVAAGLAVAGLVVVVYVAGILCHVLGRLASLPARKALAARDRSLLGRAFGVIETSGGARPGDDLVRYLWNLSSLGWNISVALLVATLARGRHVGGVDWSVLGLFAAALTIYFQACGWRYSCWRGRRTAAKAAG